MRWEIHRPQPPPLVAEGRRPVEALPLSLSERCCCDSPETTNVTRGMTLPSCWEEVW